MQGIQVASPSWSPNFRARRLALGLALLVLSAASALAITQGAPAQDSAAELEAKMGELESNVDQQGDLQSRIDAQNEQINAVIAAESELRRKADGVQAELDARQAELDEATQELNDQKAYLAEIRARLNRAMAALEDLLVQMYKSNDADTLGVVLNADSWDEVVSQTDYINRIQEHDEAVVERVSGLREEIEVTVAKLQEVQERIKVARDEVAARRAELADAQGEIEAQHSQLVAMRSERQADLAALQARESTLEKDLGTSIPGPGERAALINGEAVAPAGAPLVVKAVIDAANNINDKPYVWGGGHGSFEDVGLRLLRRGQLRPERRRPDRQPARLGRLHRLGLAGRRQLDHGLRQLRPRLHGRRRPALRHLDDGRQRPALVVGDALVLGLHAPPPRRLLAPRGCQPRALESPRDGDHPRAHDRRSSA